MTLLPAPLRTSARSQRARAIARRGALLLALAAALVQAPALAHEFLPGSLTVTAAGQGRYDVAWSPPPGAPRSQPVFPPRCARSPAGAGEPRFALDCGPGGLEGSALTVTGLAPLRDEVFVRVHLGGADLTATLDAARPSLEIPPASAPRSTLSTITSFAATGAAHLLTGPDHVLFVLGLLLLVRRARALVRAITTFTIAHSLTLALQVLGAIDLPPAPVEAAIALSVLFLAREILRPGPTLARRRPWIAALAFGLLHGLGFAGALASQGVPRSALPAALFGFNVGLEIAQLALVLAAVAIARAARLLAPRGPTPDGAQPPKSLPAQPPKTAPARPSPSGAIARALPAYALGIVATFWLLSRAAAFRGP